MTDYKLVPIEPTLDMLYEGTDVYGREDCAETDVLGIYKAMLSSAPAVQGDPSYKELYKEFSEWCQNNRGLDLDCRLHTHGGPIDHGGYISNEKTRVAFAAYRAGRLLAPQPAEQQQPDVSALVGALEASLMVMTSKGVRLEKQADVITMVRSQLAAYHKQGGEQ